METVGDPSELVTRQRIADSITRLQRLPSRAEILARAPQEVCVSCGFSRALLSRIQGSLWIPEVLHADDPPEEFVQFVATVEIPLRHMLLETDMVRRRRAEFVTDARTHPRVFPDIIRLSRAHSYTATPLLLGRRAVGFLHCDRLGQDQPITAADRDNLWSFAIELGIVIESAGLRERIAAVRRDGQRRLERAHRDLDTLATAPLSFSEEPVGPLGAEEHDERPPSHLLFTLSPREREILDLLVTGQTTSGLADQLVLSEATVKTHLSSIMRKLRVRTRAEAVARYLHATRHPAA